jgi:transposase
MEQNKCEKAKHRKVYDEEFKRAVVDHWRSSGKSTAQIAAEFGIPAGNLRVWKSRYGLNEKAGGVEAPKSPEELSRENTQLRRELARVILQRDILKKTLLIVSEASNKDIV